MNVEELKEIAETVVADLQQTDAATELQALQQSLQALVANPADPGSQSNVSAARTSLENHLRAGQLDELNPRWRDLLTEMGLEAVLPNELLDRVSTTLGQNDLTPQVAHDAVAELVAQVNATSVQMTKLVEALDHLGIEASSLAPGEFEAAVLIPRDEVSNGLAELGQEFKDLETLIRPFVEADDGSPPPLQVRQIASSEFLALVAMAPGAALLLSKAIDGVLGVYERVLKIRKLHRELNESGLQDTTLETIAQDATDMVEREIPEIVREVMNGAANLTADPGRRNEIEVSLTKSVAGIARRVDHGFRMTVRAGPPVESEETDDEEEHTPTPAEIELQQLRAEVVSNQRRAESQQLEGEPILRQLNTGASDDEETPDDTE